jgi:hypothetical protein
VHATPDRHTLPMVSPARAINATLYDKLNFICDIAPVASISVSSNFMEVLPRRRFLHLCSSAATDAPVVPLGPISGFISCGC